MTVRDRISIRAMLAGLTVACVLAGSALAATGCGEAVEQTARSAMLRAASEMPVATMDTQTVDTSATEPPAAPLSLHDRVMAEQGRDGEATDATILADAIRNGAPALPAPTVSDALRPPTAEPESTTNPPASSAQPTIDPAATTATILADGQTPIRGIWSGTAEQLTAFLTANCPQPRFTVPTLELAGYYIRYCAEAGLRADLLWAQMALETGYGAYGGDVSPDQNNFAGIGATGGGVAGAAFVSAEAGVMAQVAHMVAYVYANDPISWANSTTDPRYDFVNPRGAAAVLADLNGRWAVPGTTYGQHIEDIARNLNASVK